MDINKVNKGSYPDKGIRKTRDNQPVSKSGTDSTRPSSKAGSPSDTFTASGPEFKGEVEFARNVLSKLEADSLSSLKKIKRKIQQGEYNREEVHQKVGNLMQKDLDSLESVLTSMPGIDESSGERSLNPEYREYLVKNPSVVRDVADKISREIRDL